MVVLLLFILVAVNQITLEDSKRATDATISHSFNLIVLLHFLLCSSSYKIKKSIIILYICWVSHALLYPVFDGFTILTYDSDTSLKAHLTSVIRCVVRLSAVVGGHCSPNCSAQTPLRFLDWSQHEQLDRFNLISLWASGKYFFCLNLT